MTERFPNFPAGTRVRVTEAYVTQGVDGKPEPDAAAKVGKTGTVQPGGVIYIKVLLDDGTYELFAERELEVVESLEPLAPVKSIDDFARELYTLFVVRIKWEGKFKASPFLPGDDGSYDTQSNFIKDAWREYARKLAEDNFVSLDDA